MSVNVLGKRVTVIGLGVHGGGLGTVRWLLTHGAHVLISDRKSAQALATPKKIIEAFWRERHKKMPTLAPIQWGLGVREHPRTHITGADLIIVNPDVNRRSPIFTLAKRHGIPLRVGDTSLFIEEYPGPIVGITGTRGKTTTTALVGEMVKQYDPRSFIGGNLRISPLEQLDGATTTYRRFPWAILELSSWQVEGLADIKKSPRIAVITNIMPDHLNRYASMNAYARAKAQILRYQRPDDIAVLNADDPRVKACSHRVRGSVWWTSSHRLPSGVTGVCIDRGAIWLQTPTHRSRVVSVDDIELQGEHLRANVVTAVAVASAVGVPLKRIVTVIKRFAGVPGRLEQVAMIDGVSYYNDTTATIPEAAIAAMQTLCGTHQRQCILIAGGADKELSYQQFANEICDRVKLLILFEGDASAKVLHALESLKKRGVMLPPIVSGVREISFAVSLAHAVARKGDVVLLSPAAASFGVFAHAYDRGDQFSAAVKRL